MLVCVCGPINTILVAAREVVDSALRVRPWNLSGTRLSGNPRSRVSLGADPGRSTAPTASGLHLRSRIFTGRIRRENSEVLPVLDGARSTVGFRGSVDGRRERFRTPGCPATVSRWTRSRRGRRSFVPMRGGEDVGSSRGRQTRRSGTRCGACRVGRQESGVNGRVQAGCTDSRTESRMFVDARRSARPRLESEALESARCRVESPGRHRIR